jgi:hypothetical protein
MSGWTAAWTIWLLLFGAIEGPALARKAPGATLSEHLWAWFAVKDKAPQWRLRRFALAAGLAWLSLHLLTGGAF